MAEEKTLEERSGNVHSIGLIPGHCFHVWYKDRKNGTCVSGPVRDFMDVTMIEIMRTVGYAGLVYEAVSKLM